MWIQCPHCNRDLWIYPEYPGTEESAWCPECQMVVFPEPPPEPTLGEGHVEDPQDP